MRWPLNICAPGKSPGAESIREQSESVQELGRAFVLMSAFALTLVVPALAQAATQAGSAPYRLSVTAAGNSHSPVFSADGRHVAFVSHASNLVTNENPGPHLNLFLRDLAASNTVLVSVGTNGFGGANNNIGLYTLSSNAQVVAFDTAANNLAPGDTNRVSDIYVRDLVSGTTRLVSVNADGTGSGNGPSSHPLLSEDGRHVIFESLASNLVTNDFNGTNDIFICDLASGTIELVSLNAEGAASPDGPSHSPSISADGLAVAFVSQATNLVEGVTNRLGEVYARNVAAGSTRWAVASHIPETHQTWPAGGGGAYQASEPVLSADGRFVAFKTLGQAVRMDLTRPTNSLFVFITNSPRPELQISRVNFHDNPRPAVSTDVTPLAFSHDGRFLAVNTASNVFPPGLALIDFEFLTTNVIESPNPGFFTTNITATVNLSLTNQGPAGKRTWLRMPWLGLNADASRTCFLSDATNLVAGTTNRLVRLYALNLTTGALGLLHANTNGQANVDLSAIVPALSPDGSLAAWDSPDDDIVANDLNRAWDVFVRNVDTGEPQLISMRHPDLPAASGTALSRLDLNPGAISANGQRLAILSLDSTLVPDDTNNWRDLVVRDLVTRTNIDVGRSIGRVWYSSQTNFPGTNTAAASSLSADGRFVAFAGDALLFPLSTNRAIYWRDLEAPTNRVVVDRNENNPGGVSYPVLSSNGRLVAFHSAGIHDLYYGDSNGQSDVFVRLLTPHPPLLDCSPAPFLFAPVFISVADGTTTTANGHSVNPSISPDSAWVLFQSRAANLLSTPIPAPPTYQLYGRGVRITSVISNACGPVDVLVYTSTRLMSYSTSASPGPTGTSIDLPLPGGGANPRFSADSRYVAFESATNLIYRHDLLNDWVITVTEQDGAGLTNFARLTNTLVCSTCGNPTLNSDGRYVAYETRRVANAANDIFVKDLQTGQEELISMNFNGSGGGNGSSSTPLLSYDARFVVFASKASDLVPGDNNRTTDLFVRDRFNSVTHCLSRNWSGTGTGNRVSSNPIMSADGRTVAFQSFASDLVPGDYNDTRDVFVVTLAGPDTDGDHMDDDWEMAYFSTLARDGSGDFDSDGASDLAEFRAGTNPANDTSILRVLQITTALDQLVPARRRTVLLWSAVPGRQYRVQFKDSFSEPWMTLTNQVTAASTSASLTDTLEPPYGGISRRRFYRVLLAQ